LLVFGPYWIHIQRKYERVVDKLAPAFREHNAVFVRCGGNGEEFSRESREIRERYGFHPHMTVFWAMKPFLFAAVPMHMTMMIACRTIYPRFEEARFGGFSFFTDLTEINTSYMFPTCIGLMTAVCVLQRTRRAYAQPSKHIKSTAFFLGVTSAMMMSISWTSHYALNLYVASNITTMALMSSAMLNDRVRNAVGLRPLEYTKFHLQRLKDIEDETVQWNNNEFDPRAADKWASARMHVFEETGSKTARMDLESVEFDAPAFPGESVYQKTEEEMKKFRELKRQWFEATNMHSDASQSEGYFTRGTTGVIKRDKRKTIEEIMSGTEPDSEGDDVTEVVLLQSGRELTREERKRRIREYEYDFEGAAEAAKEDREEEEKKAEQQRLLEESKVPREFSFLDKDEVDATEKDISYRELLQRRKEQRMKEY
jgi:hypothetical protein